MTRRQQTPAAHQIKSPHDKRIKIVGGKAPRMQITSKLAAKIDPNEIGSALGAERVSRVNASTAPLTPINDTLQSTQNTHARR